MSRPTIRSWRQADAFLGHASDLSTGQRGTRIKRETETKITVWYHDTPVVTYYKPGASTRLATIDVAGWKTPTTVARINEYAPEGVEVYTQGLDGPEVVLLDDPDEGVERWSLTSGAYHKPHPTPTRSAR
jgi:hypothetical protein